MDNSSGGIVGKRIAFLAILLTGGACDSAAPGSSYDPNNDESLGVATSVEAAIAGNVAGAIQIDGPANTNMPGADLFANVGTPVNVGATLDWVADSSATTAETLLRCIDDTSGPANCAEPGVTMMANGTGNWNGVRIVDGVAQGDLNIFLTGGKENDTTTWNIGPGSVGSSKYDITQAYLANNQTSLFFGMERRGNNGTTAFDFEFNQAAPMSNPACVQSATVPCRTVGDILFTFEMQGSGGSGSATPYVFEWNGSAYVPWSPDPGQAVPVATINNSTSTAGAPWGHVSSNGNWIGGNMDRFTFAEAIADLSLLPGVSTCGGRAFVQVRTRSSSTATSDLKDTTRVFEFVFGSITASANLTPSCAQQFGYAASAVDQNNVAVPSQYLGCEWTFSNGGGVSAACSGNQAVAPGTYSGTVTVTDTRFDCDDDATTGAVNVYAPLGVTADLTAACVASLAVGYDANATGGSGSYGYDWSFGDGSSSSSENGSLTGTAATPMTGDVTVTDLRTDLPGECMATDGDSATPYAPLHVDLALVGDGDICVEGGSDAVMYQVANATGGTGAYNYTWNGQSCSGTSCTIDPSNDDFCAEASVSVTLSDQNGAVGCVDDTSETETYSKVTTISASQNP